MPRNRWHIISRNTWHTFTRNGWYTFPGILKIYRDLKNVVDTAFDDGKVEGKAEGKAEGIVEGIQQQAMEDAKRLKDAGVDIETIARCIDLPITIVEGL